MNIRNRNRLLYGIVGVVVAAGVTYACKDFLDQPAQGTVEVASLETSAGVEGSLIAAYRSLDCSSSSAGSWGCAASNWVWGSVPSGDAHKGSNAGDQQPINDIETYYWSVGEAEGYLNQKWAQVYDGVFRANATLNLLAKVRATKPLEISDADAASIRGEALFLRAHYHFEAYRMWGHIPYYSETDTTAVTDGGYRKPNNLALDSIVKLIIADLNTAYTLLPATPRNGELGRATKWTARAYKGRVQAYGAALTPALWDSAAATLRAVRDSGPYRLETSFDHVWTGFSQYRDGPETILAFQASVRDGATGLLYRSAEEFEDKLRALLDDAALRRRLAAQAYAWVGEHRLLCRHYRQRRDWYAQLLDRLPELNEELRRRIPELFSAD